MTLIGAGRSEFTQFMADHVFGHIDRNMFAAIMHSDGMSHKIRQNSRTAGPCILRPFSRRLAFIVSIFFIRLSCTKGPFFDGSGHDIGLPSRGYFVRRLTIILSDCFLRRVFTPCAHLPQGVTGCLRPTGERPSPPPCGWSQGIHCYAAVSRTHAQPARTASFTDRNVFMSPSCQLGRWLHGS